MSLSLRLRAFFLTALCLRMAVLSAAVLSTAVLGSAAAVGADAEDDFTLARNLLRGGDPVTASQLLADFIRNYPGDSHLAEARLLLARAFATSDRCGDAVPAFQSFYEQHPDDLAAAEARRERATCLQTLGRHRRAAEAFADVQRRYSESDFAAEALLSAADEYLRAGDMAAAVQAYSRLLGDYGSARAARRGRIHLARLRFAGGDPAGAQDLLAEVIAAAPSSDAARDALRLSGNIHLVLGNTGPATAAFDRLHRGFAGSAASDSAYLELAANHLSQGRYDKAVSAYTTGAERIADPSLQARARLGGADALRLGGKAAAALTAYEGLVDATVPDTVRQRARLGQAIALGMSGRFGPAVGLFLQLVQTGGGDEAPTPVAAAATRELGALYRRQGDLARAGSWFRRYLDDAERFGDAFPETAAERDLTRLQLAQVYDAGGYHDEAVRLFADLSRGTGPLAAEAQYGLAAAYEGSGARRLAIGEYDTFLERHPGHRRAAQVRQRVEYLREYTIADPEGLSQALQQAYVAELSGVARQQVRLDVARALRDHQDFANAVRAWETFAASYPDDPAAAEAQFYLADCLYRLSRQRQLEGDSAAADSLHALALQEDRILGDAGAGHWSRLAQLRRVESVAATAPDTARARLLEAGYADFLEQNLHSDDTREARARAWLGLGDARLQAAGDDSMALGRADDAYASLLAEAAGSPQAPRARFGRAVVRLRRGQADAAIDSLRALLPTLPGSDLQPRVLSVLGRALAQAGRPGEAATRLRELLLAWPDFEARRAAQELLADTYLQLGEAQRAGELYASLAESDPDGDVSGSLRRRWAEARQGAGDDAGALSIYERLLAEGAGDADALHLARGRVLAALGRSDDAIAAFGRVRAGTPSATAAALGAADLHFAAGRFQQAFDGYQPLLQGDAADAGLVGRAVLCLYELGRRKEADQWAGRHRKRFGAEGVWPYLFRLYEGRSWLAKKDWDKARKTFAGVAEDAAETPAATQLHGAAPVELTRMAADPAAAGAYYAATAEWEKMRADPSEEGTARALQAQSNYVRDHAESPFAPDVYLRLAETHQVLGNLLPAAGAFRHVVDHPHATLEQKYDAIWQLLRCYTRLYQWDDALRVAQRILDDFPQHPQTTHVQLEIGYILSQTGQHAAAIDYLQKVLEWADGEDAAEARFYIGEAYRNLREFRKAVTAYAQVAYYGADASTNWINSADFARAGCYEELGEPEQARGVYERIIQREGATSEYGRVARQAIDSLPPSPLGSRRNSP